MSWFKRKKDDVQIPPVSVPPSFSSEDGRPPSYRSNASTYNRSRDGELDSGKSYGNSNYGANNAYGKYKSQSYNDDNGGAPPPNDGDNRDYRSGRNNSYVRDEQSPVNANRNKLFEGAAPIRQGFNKYATDGPGGELPETTGNEDEDVEAIKQQTRFLKQDTVQSSRNALRIAREAEETGRATLLRLGDQSERLANTERHLDVSKGHSQRAEDSTAEIKQLNRSIFIPVVTFNKNQKRREQELKRERRFQDEQTERERSMMDIRDSQNRLGRAATYGDEGDEEGIGYRRGGRSESDMAARKQARSRYQFEATASDDELEDEIDGNVDEIGDTARRLNKLALAMGQEITQQNERLDRIAGKTDKLTMKIDNNTERLKRIK